MAWQKMNEWWVAFCNILCIFFPKKKMPFFRSICIEEGLWIRYINSLALELFTFFVMNVWCFRFILNFNYLDKAYLCVEDFKKGKNWKNGALNFSKKIKPKSWPEYRFHLEYKNSYFLHWNFDWKSCFVVFFFSETIHNSTFQVKISV